VPVASFGPKSVPDRLRLPHRRGGLTDEVESAPLVRVVCARRGDYSQPGTTKMAQVTIGAITTMLKPHFISPL
jgi:hypothetical protein